VVSQINTPHVSAARDRHRRRTPHDGPRLDGHQVMDLEALSDAAFVVRQAQIGRDAAEGLRQDGNGGAIVIALGVARPLRRGNAAFYPVGANARQLDAKATVAATQISPLDLIQREWPGPQGLCSSGDHVPSVTGSATSPPHGAGTPLPASIAR